MPKNVLVVAEGFFREDALHQVVQKADFDGVDWRGVFRVERVDIQELFKSVENRTRASPSENCRLSAKHI